MVISVFNALAFFNSYAQFFLYDTTNCTIISGCSSQSTDNYDNVLKAWRVLIKKCPVKSKTLYIDGVKIFKRLIKDETDSLPGERCIDTLLLIYDLRLSYYPDTAFVYARKACSILKYRKSEIDKAYSLLKKSIEIDKKVEPVKIYLIHQRDRNFISPEQVIA